METIRCAVTGPLGNVGYSLVFFLAQGGVFGPSQKISLRLVEIPALANQLTGLKMELEDCAFPTLSDVEIGTDPNELFGDVDCVFLVGATPRGPGMERKDLLLVNGDVFQAQGRALERSAKKKAHILVVGNPCNTNCLITLHNCPKIPPSQFAAMTLLDENRSRALLARTVHANVEDISPVLIWGNHSSTLVPDISTTMIGARPATRCVDEPWQMSTLLPVVRQRGAEIIKARGKSSAASAALSSIMSMRVLMGLEGERLASMGVHTKNNMYGIDQDLVFSFPCRHRNGTLIVDSSIRPAEHLWVEIRATERELIEERDVIRHLLVQ